MRRPATSWPGADTRWPCWTSTAKPHNGFAEDLRAEGVTALAVAADVSDRAAVEEAFAKVRTELGPVHILVTSAGLVDFAPFAEITVRVPGSG